MTDQPSTSPSPISSSSSATGDVPPSKSQQSKHFMLFLVWGSIVFVTNSLLPSSLKLLYLAIPAASIAIAVVARKRDALKPYFPLAFTFCASSIIQFLIIPFASGTGIAGKTFNVFASGAIIIVGVIVATKISRNDMGSILLKRGNLKKSLLLGLIGFFAFFVTAIPASIYIFGGEELSTDQVLGLVPWIAAFVTMNALREELLYRSFFLTKYSQFLGADAMNWVQAIYFGLAHMGLPFHPVYFMYVPAALFLGLGFGAIMQKSGSSIGAILFHAGSDIPVMLAVFSTLV